MVKGREKEGRKEAKKWGMMKPRKRSRVVTELWQYLKVFMKYNK